MIADTALFCHVCLRCPAPVDSRDVSQQLQEGFGSKAGLLQDMRQGGLFAGPMCRATSLSTSSGRLVAIEQLRGATSWCERSSIALNA